MLIAKMEAWASIISLSFELGDKNPAIPQEDDKEKKRKIFST